MTEDSAKVTCKLSIIYESVGIGDSMIFPRGSPTFDGWGGGVPKYILGIHVELLALYSLVSAGCLWMLTFGGCGLTINSYLQTCMCHSKSAKVNSSWPLCTHSEYDQGLGPCEYQVCPHNPVYMVTQAANRGVSHHLWTTAFKLDYSRHLPGGYVRVLLMDVYTLQVSAPI